MSNKSGEKLTFADFAFLVIIFVVFVGSLVYVFAYKQRQTPNEISLVNFEDPSSYDISLLNKADKEAFMKVKGVGEVKATTIIAYRDSLGGFDNIHQLLDIDSINAELFEAIILHFYYPSDEIIAEDDSNAEVAPPQEIDDTLKQTDDITETNTDDSDANDSVDEPSEPSEPTRRKVNINEATAKEIADCLLITDEQAEQIVYIRELIGGYSNINELALCSLITEEKYLEIFSYIEL